MGNHTTVFTLEDVELIQDKANTYPLAGEAEDGLHFDPKGRRTE
jgi:hypothetical protein